MIWGFSIKGIKQPLVNARVESARNKVTFRESWQRRRCVIPASYYFEWSHIQSGGRRRTGDKYVIQPAGSSAVWFAGLYRIEESHTGLHYPVFTILTKDAVPELSKIHDRMPVMIDKKDIDVWIRPEAIPKGLRSPADLVVEKA